MAKISLKWRKAVFYAQLPEMRLFWIFLPFLIALLAINVVYLPQAWLIVAVAAIFLFLTIMIFTSDLRLAKSNFEANMERNEMKSIVFNLRDGVIAYDPNFKVLIFNKAAEAIFGLNNNEIMGQYLSPDKAQTPRLRLISQVIFPSLAPMIIRRSDPGVYPQVADVAFSEPKLDLRVTTDRILDPQGRLLGFVKIVHDRTREKELMQAKTEFIGIAAHQLRTPLTAIHWALENLAGQQMANDDQKQIVDTAYNAAAKLMKTVNDLLDVTKIEEGRFGYQFENADMADFIESSIADVRDLAEKAGIKLYFNRPKEPVMVTIDKQKLGMVIFNFLDNAIRYNVQNGEVVVSVEKLPDKPYAQVSVKDTGIGIPSEQINNLFTKFFRADNAQRFSPDGSGLGIYIAKNVVKRHGGEIWAESEINRGSTFYFTIPTDPALVPPKEIVYGEE